MGASEAPVEPGDILAGKYRVEKVLGVGGMGVVVAAMHLDLDQRVALKFLLPAAAAKPEIVERFLREARNAAQIRGEHVARVTDRGRLENGTPYIVMEYLEGGDLAALVEEKGPLPVPVAVDYVLQACVAIAEAHAAGIVHRDLKPANLFLARQGDGTDIIKVVDFGISKAIVQGAEQDPHAGALTKTTDVFGSPMYMSPEQLKSSRSVDARADIWALGVILFELVFGRAPFERGTVAEIFGAILHEKAPSLRAMMPAAPEGLSQIIDRCLEKDPEARYPNVGALAQALAPFGTAEAKTLVTRIGRMMRNSGVELGAPAADGAPLPDAAGLNAVAERESRDIRPPAPGVSTRTAWAEQEGAPKPRSAGKIIAIAVPVVAALGIGLFLALRSHPTGGATPTSTGAADHVGSVSAAPIASAAPPVVEATHPLVVPSDDGAASGPIPRAPSGPSAEVAAPLPSTSASADVSSKLPASKHPVSGTGTKKGGGTHTPKEDPNDFGGRK